MSRARFWKIDRAVLAALVAYTVLAVIIFLPLVLNFDNSSLTPYIRIAQSRDRYHFMWNFWWVSTALTTHQNILSSSLMFAPNGVSLALQTMDFVDAILSAPIAYFFGYVAAYNFVILLSIILSGFTAFLLARHLTGSWIASFGAGLVFAFFPQHLNQAFYGHPNLASLEWLPAYLLALLLAYERKSFRYSVLAGVFLTLITLTELELLIMAIAITAVYLAYVLLKTRFSSLRKFVLLSLATIGTWLLLSSEYLIPAYLAVVGGVRAAPSPLEVYANAAKPIFYITPPPESYMYTSFFSNSYSTLSPYLLGKLHGGGPQFIIFLGYITLGLAAIGVITSKDSRRFFLIGLAAIAFILSLGPSMNPSQLSLQTPYTFLYDHVNILHYFRAGARFSTVLELALMGLAAFGIDSILKLSRGRGFYHPARTKIIGIVILSLILFEFFPVVNVQSAAADPVYDIIKSDNSGYFTVLELPATITVTQTALYHQIYYDKPLVNGKISQISVVLPEYMYVQLSLRILAQSPGVTKEVKEHLVDQPYGEIQLTPFVMTLYRIKYVLVNYNEYPSRTKADATVNMLVKTLGAPVYFDQNVLLFELPHWVSSSQVLRSAPIVLFGNGWSTENKTGRSVVNDANLFMFAPSSGMYSVQMTSTAQICLRNLNISQLTGCGSYDPSLHTFDASLWLYAGENTIALQVSGGTSNVSLIKVR
ncbi:MAG: hypothetical protein OK457_07390 [Thaumarchaeota archaeon]|nr:hypothetical protein [Nitrososphaerota archaeon]